METKTQADLNQEDIKAEDVKQEEVEATPKEQVAMNEPKKVDQEVGVLYIGMDLGTSRTSIAASNGKRETIASVVGYPKDVVSMKLFKKLD